MSNDIKAGGAFVEITTKDSAFYRGLSMTEKALRGWVGKVATIGIGANVGLFGIESGLDALRSLASSASIVGLSKQFAAAGGAIDDMAQRTGLGAEQLSALDYAARLSDTSLEDIAKGVKTLGESITKALAGDASASNELANLGLDLQALARASQYERLLMVSDAIAQIPEPAARASAAVGILGKSGLALLPLINNGSKGIGELTNRARELGVVMSAEDVAAAAELGDSFDELGAITASLTNKLGAAFAPAVMDGVKALGAVVKPIGAFVSSNKELLRYIVPVVGGIAGAATAAAVLGAAVAFIGPWVVPILGVGAALVAVGVAAAGVKRNWGTLTSFATSTWKALSTFLKESTGVFGSNIKAVLQSAVGYFHTFAKQAIEFFGAIGRALIAGDLQAAFSVVTAGFEIAWVAVINTLSSTWFAFRDSFLSSWVQATAFFQLSFVNAFATIENAWGSVVDAMGLAWGRFADSVSKFWGELVGGARLAAQALKMSLARMRTDYGPAMKKQLDAEMVKLKAEVGQTLVDKENALQKAAAERTKQTNERSAQRKVDVETARASMERDIRAGVQQGNQERDQAAKDRATRAAEALTQAQAQYAAALNATRNLAAPKILKDAKLANLPDAMKTPPEQTQTAQGDFSAAAAALGSQRQNYNQDFATKLGQMVDLLRLIERKNMGLL